MQERDIIRETIAAHFPTLPIQHKVTGWIAYCYCSDAFGAKTMEGALAAALDHSAEMIKKAIKVEAAARG